MRRGLFADTGGRPLGVTFDAAGDTLYVADALLGLLSVDGGGRVTVLVNEAEGEPATFADNLDVDGAGTVWFSAPTREHTLAQVALDVWDSRPSGRLLHYDPRTKATRVVLDNLFYANGVAVAQDDSFVLVAEFLAFRITRYWLTGPRAGTHDVFVDGLPGYPDNITRTPDGHFLVGLSLQRVPGLDKQRPHPWAVKMIYRLPSFLKPQGAVSGVPARVRRDRAPAALCGRRGAGRRRAGDGGHGPAGRRPAARHARRGRQPAGAVGSRARIAAELE